MAVFEDSQTSSGIKRILMLIGKTGSGKSSTANTILGRECFEAQIGFNSQTKECNTATTKSNGQEILVIDTPGLGDTDGDDKVIAERITECLCAVTPGPHAVILVLRGNARFTDDEIKVFNMLKDIFGEDMKSYLIVIFVGKDGLDKKNVNFEKQLENSKNARHVVKEASDRYLLFNNNGTSEEKDQMVKALMQQVERVVMENGGSCFEHKMADEVNDTMSKVLNEEVRRLSALISMADAEEIESSEGPAEAAEAAIQEKPKPANPEQSWTNRRKPSLENDTLSLADQEKIKRIKEVADLKGKETVRIRRQNFISFVEESWFGRPTNAAQDSPIIHWPWGEKARMEKILDSLLDEAVEELKLQHDSGFIQVPAKPKMTMAEKLRLLEDALRKKIISHPEKMNEAQREEMENLVKSVGQKIKRGKTKFSLKSIECSIM